MTETSKPEDRVAIGVSDTELASYQRAVRVLLTDTIITAHHPGADDLERLRRWAPQLEVDLQEVAGYRLDLTSTSVRLVRRLDRLDPTQPLEVNDRAFDRRRYAYLCLCLAALGRSGSQTTLSELAANVRSAAAEIPSLGFDPDKHAQRVAFVDVVLYLERRGAIAVADGSTASWQKDPEAGEALYDIDRDVCHQLFMPARVIQHVRTVGDLLETQLPLGRDARRAATKQRLVRLLLEYPVVYFDDLTEGDRRYLQNEARELGTDLERLTGAQLERRAEGLALIDTAASFSDRRFPNTGTPAHVALLLAERIVEAREAEDARPTVRRPATQETQDQRREDLDRARPKSGRVETLAPVVAEGASDETSSLPASDGEEARLPLIGDVEIAAWIDAIIGRYPIAKDYRNDPARLARDALRLLEEFDLVRCVPGGCVPLPAIARYRIVVATKAVDTKEAG